MRRKEGCRKISVYNVRDCIMLIVQYRAKLSLYAMQATELNTSVL